MTVLYSVMVRSSDKTSSKVLVIGDCGAHLISASGTPTIEATVFWTDLNTIAVNSGLVRLNTDFAFCDSDRNVRRLIGEAIQRQSSKRMCGVLEVSSLTSTEFRVANRGLYARFMARVIESGAQLLPETREAVIEWISAGNQAIVIDPGSLLGVHLGAFLNAIAPSQTLQSLIIPPLEKVDIYDTSAKYLRQPVRIQHISLSGKATARFHDFCLAIESNNKLKVKALTLRDAKLSEEQIGDLKSACLIRKLTALGLINCFESMESLLSFLSPEVMEPLKILRLDGHKGVNFPALIGIATKVEVLSLADCNLQISDVIQNLGGATLGLGYLNISGNFGRGIPDLTVKLPATLRRIDVNDIDWSNGALSGFLWGALDTRWPNGIVLSVSQIKCQPEEWVEVQTVFSQYRGKSGITQLSWNGNPLFPEFVRLLRHSPNLRHLYLNDCKRYAEVDDSFASYVGRAPRLRSLYLRGLRRRPELTGLFQECENAPALSTLDVRDNGIRDDGLIALESLLLKNPTLTMVAFDGSEVSSLGRLFKFGEHCRRVKRRIYIDFPSKDLRFLRATDEEVVELKRLFLQFTPHDPEDEWIEPFSIFRLVNTDSLPFYMSSGLARALHDPIELERSEEESAVRPAVVGSSRLGKPRSEYAPPDWEFPLKLIDTIDISMHVKQYKESFSLQNLATAIANEKRAES
jgi:hypothetical protein